MIKEIHKEEYPVTLQNMKAPPQKLYIRGELPKAQEQKYLCIVGSRKSSSYGTDVVSKIINGLRGYPISIISGLAFGIDSAAHAAAIEANLNCIAFPGSSLEWSEIYPSKHLELAQTIVNNGGALISEWQSGYPTGRWAFPSRNRLMAGISHAILIIEAAQKSGSLMTAKHAEEFNRDVLAVPGPIDSPRSYGPHMLIKNGAALITSSYDVLEALGFETTRTDDSEAGKSQRIKKVPDYMRQDSLTCAVLETLDRGPVTINSLLEITKAAAHALNERLSLLELEGLVRIEGTRITRIYL